MAEAALVGRTPVNAIKRAVRERDVELVRGLLLCRPELRTMELHDNYNLLQWLLGDADCPELVRVLIQANVPIQGKKATAEKPLYLAVYHNRNESVKLLLDAKAEMSPYLGGELLSRAVHYASCDLVKTLLDAKADPTKNGVLLLCGSHADKVEALLDAKADINTQDRNKDTLLSIAARYGYDDVIRVLLRRGADHTLENQDAYT